MFLLIAQKMHALMYMYMYMYNVYIPIQSRTDGTSTRWRTANMSAAITVPQFDGRVYRMFAAHAAVVGSDTGHGVLDYAG